MAAGLTVLETMLGLMGECWRSAFATQASLDKAVEFAKDFTLSDSADKTIAGVLESRGKGQENWKPVYELFSESKWNAADLTAPVVRHVAPRKEPRRTGFRNWLVRALDDTLVRKGGAKTWGVRCARDPMSLPYHLNLVNGVRALQVSTPVPHYTQDAKLGVRALPVACRIVPAAKKPGKKATDEQMLAYAEEKKQNNLNIHARDMLIEHRAMCDREGLTDPMLVVADGCYTNSRMYREPIDRVELLGRVKGNARLFHPAKPESRRVYDLDRSFTPEQARRDPTIKWRKLKIHYGGKQRKVQAKIVRGILWKGGAARRPLTLIVIRPTPYRTGKKGKMLYRLPAYLLTTVVDIDLGFAVQAYFDRNAIEENFRDEKSVFGAGDARLRLEDGVRRYIPFCVAVYSLAILASQLALGPSRTDDYAPHPRWRRRPQTRPTLRDIVRLMRQEELRLARRGSTVLNPPPRKPGRPRNLPSHPASCPC